MDKRSNIGTIKVKAPERFESEKKYIISVFAEDFLGLDLSLSFDSNIDGYHLYFDEKSIRLPDVFFNQGHFEGKTTNRVEDISFASKSLPAWFYLSDEDWDCKADIFGMAFFLLSGYADLHFSDKDIFDRNIGNTSFLAKKELIDRPIIQEWFLILANQLLEKQHVSELGSISYKKHVSHDVDQPFEYLNYTLGRLFKRVLGDILIRKDIRQAKKRLGFFLSVRNGNYEIDPYNNFFELIELLDKYKIISTFFFVASDNKHPNDVGYSIDQEAIKLLLSKLDYNGHTIGLHPSFYTYKDQNVLKTEFDKLQSVLSELRIPQIVSQSRKHYLRWDWESTPGELEATGITDDYTVGYADRSGFRVGVAFPYSAFDWKSKEKLALKLHPLIVMECTLTSPGYMGLSYEESRHFVDLYHKTLTENGGEFVLLWHNHLLLKEDDIKLFEYYLGL